MEGRREVRVYYSKMGKKISCTKRLFFFSASIVPSKGLLSSGRQGPSTGTIGGILAGLIENGVIDGGAVYEVFRCMGCSSQCQQGAFECGCCATGTCQGK